MSKPSPPTTLPPLNCRSTSTTTSVNNEGAAPAIDYVALYRQYCAEEGCKANSAFVRYIQDRGGHFSLERLNLGCNYLGSKGLRPVLRMIDLCQTIVSINLENNGISNDAVADLCAVLERHVSCASLNLRRNPISVVGGKRLLQLAETNPRMMEILMDGTDIFEGLQERIRMALQHNAAVAKGSGPQMEAYKDGTRPDVTSNFSSSNDNNSNSSTRVNRQSSKRPEQTRTQAAAAAKLPPPKASLQPIHSLNGTLNNAAGDVPAAATAVGAAMYGSSPASGAPTAASTGTAAASVEASVSASAGSAGRLGWQEATLRKTQPRPPTPAVASHASKAMPLNKVMDLKALFAERARLHTEVNRGEASRRAYAVRQELQALERHGRPVSDTNGSSSASIASTAAAAAGVAGVAYGASQTYPGAATTKTKLLLPSLSSDNNNSSNSSSNGGQRVGPGAEQPSASSLPRTHANSEVPPPTAVAAGGGLEGPANAQPDRSNATFANNSQNASSSGDAAAAAAAACQTSANALAPAPPPASSPQPPSQQAPPRPLAHTVEDVLDPARMMLLTTEEQFTVLFDQGCREYMNRNLDAAYMAWNDAMRLAVGEGQREWMAVVASNLQRLSYELLVEEGANYLEHGDLEKAGETFNLALEVAVKAKNAVWERDMRLAKQNVQKALFHRCHEAALLLFSRAQEDARDAARSIANHRRSKTSNSGSPDDADYANGVTEDDYFVLPGTDEMIRHTSAFVREWSCLLLLKEAVGLWVEGTRVVSRLSEVAAAPLRENITEALNLVASFIAQRHFNDTTPTGLLWFNTDAYLYHECVLLSDLWYDLVADSEQSLRHPLLSAVCAAQLGELYVATFQLPQALAQLEKLVRYGSLHKSPVLEATGLTLCGRVHLQRASYALAETTLEAALELWATVQNDPVVKQLMSGASSGGIAHDVIAPMDSSAIAADMTNTTAPTSTTTTGAATVPAQQSTTTNTNGGGAADAAALVSTPASDGAHGGNTRFRIEAHLPPDAVTVLASACRHYKVCLLLQTYRYRDALETLEYGLNVSYHDMLQEKLGRNYHLNPSIDEIAAIAGVLRTSLVFYTLTARYDWSATQNAYQAEESLCMWVLAESREMRFVEVNLTTSFKCSLQDLLGSLRQRLCVEPEVAMQSEIITELPSRSWQEPLRVLYQACILPIIGYVRAADPQLLFGDGVMTVVPTGLLWLVPFHALLNVKAGDRYLVEEVAIQFAFSATQAAFASLSSARVQQRDLHREVVAVQTDTDQTVMDSLFYSAFPFNADRSIREGEVVAAVLRAGQAQVAERQLKKAAATAASGSSSTNSNNNNSTNVGTFAPETTIFTDKVERVENAEALRAVLPRARTLHIATATTAAIPLPSPQQPQPLQQHLSLLLEERRGRQRPEDEGGLLMSAASPIGDVAIVRAAEIAHMELFAEHVILTNTNVSPEHVRDTRDDVLGLVRSFFGSGVPCVIAGQWCTPDMEPIELFQRFYTLWCRPPNTSSNMSLHSVTQLDSDAGAGAELSSPTNNEVDLRGSDESGVSSATAQAAAATRTESFNKGLSQQQQGALNSLNNNNSSDTNNNGGSLSDRNATGCDGEGEGGSATATAIGGGVGGEEDGEVVRHRALLLARAIRRLLAEEPGMRYRPRVWAGYYCIGTGW